MPLGEIDITEFQRRLDMIRRVFVIDDLDGRGKDRADIAQYYRQSSLGYRFVHSDSGAMHMALNPGGVFDRAGYYGQADAVAELIDDQTRRVLELASGKGFNSNYLAARHLDVGFLGLDLVRQQVRAARRNAGGLTNVRYLTADFHDLPVRDGCLDLVFVVESLCHALDMPRVLDQVARVLREGGLFVVVDAWRTEAFDDLPDIVRYAAQVTEHAMAVGDARRIDEWLLMVERAGLELTGDRDLTASVLPNMRRFERAAARYYRYPGSARVTNLLLPTRLVQNSIAALLMPLTVETGAHTYRLVTLKKR